MREYLIWAADGSGWIPIHKTRLHEVMLPQGWNAKRVQGWGDFRMVVDGVTISFSGEEPGWQVTFEEGEMEAARADSLLEQLRSQVEVASGVPAQVVLITP